MEPVNPATSLARHASAPNEALVPLPPLNRPRVSRVDYAKGMAVFLVVVGHVAGGLQASEVADDGISAALHALHLKNSFRMPALFLIAGIFAERSLRHGLWHYFGDKVRNLLYPYVLWNTLVWTAVNLVHALSDRFHVKMVNTPFVEWQSWVRMFYEPLQYWFFFALFVMLMIYGLMRTAGLRIRWVLALAVVAHVLARLGLLDASPLAFQVGRLLIYFTLGAGLAVQLLRVGHRAPAWIPLVVAIAAGAVMAYCASLPIMNLEPDSYHLEQAANSSQSIGVLAEQIPVRLIVSCTGITMLWALAIVFERWGAPRLIEYWGRISMEVYVCSGFGMVGARILLLNVLKVEQAWVLVAGGVAGGMIFPMLVVWLTRRMGFNYLFRWGRASRELPTAAGA